MQLLTQSSEECVTLMRAFEAATHSRRLSRVARTAELGEREENTVATPLAVPVALDGRARPGSAADSTSRQFRTEKAHLETARGCLSWPGQEEDTREMKSRIILTDSQVWERNPSAQHPVRGNKMRSYFADRFPADVNAMQDTVTRVHLKSIALQTHSPPCAPCVFPLAGSFA